jgi:putative transcriptional regulator
MPQRKRFKSPVFKAIHESASAIFKVGGMDAHQMAEFDESCLVGSAQIAPEEVRGIRESQGVTQPVFARYLNTSVSTIQKWESGAKRPSGMAVRLLEVVKRHGLKALDPRENPEPASPTQEPNASAPPEQSKVA